MALIERPPVKCGSLILAVKHAGICSSFVVYRDCWYLRVVTHKTMQFSEQGHKWVLQVQNRRPLGTGMPPGENWLVLSRGASCKQKQVNLALALKALYLCKLSLSLSAGTAPPKNGSTNTWMQTSRRVHVRKRPQRAQLSQRPKESAWKMGRRMGRQRWQLSPMKGRCLRGPGAKTKVGPT